MEMKKLYNVIATMLFAVNVMATDGHGLQRNDEDYTSMKNLEEDKNEEISRPSRLNGDPFCKPNVTYFPTSQCCERGFTYIGLSKDAPCKRINSAAGIEIIQQTSAQGGQNCNGRALLKINFEKFTKSPCDYCLRKPLCGRRMLKIDLELSSGVRSRWGFNIGDSRTNDGYKGDGNTQKNDAEMEGVFPSVRLYHSDRCPASTGSFKTFPTAMEQNVKHITIYISNQHVRIVNDQGLDETVCDDCLYALNGQADIQGINEDIYVALNRVITGRSIRNGQGICSAKFTWVCPRW